MGIAVHSLVRRIPMALGPVIGGILIEVFGRVQGIRLAFGGALVLGFIALVLQQHFIEEQRKEDSAHLSLRSFLSTINPPLRNLLVSDILIRFAEQIPYAFVVLWVVDICRQSPVRFGALTTIEMTTAVLVYLPIAYLADRSTKKPFVLITFVFFTIFPVVLLFSHSFSMLAAAFIIRGLKEFGEPTRKALILDLADPQRRAGTFGAYYLIRDSVVSIAAVGGAFLWNISPTVNLLSAAACWTAGEHAILLGSEKTSAGGLDSK